MTNSPNDALCPACGQPATTVVMWEFTGAPIAIPPLVCCPACQEQQLAGLTFTFPVALPPPSQQARDFLARRARDPQFWRLMQALGDDGKSEKGDTHE
ncbi:MAG TPA: hypothetical protein VMV29_08845 [Ktedonobacterales bacterium]|nr:hypothetical protein [Ktedonobacterales bacterium]